MVDDLLTVARTIVRHLKNHSPNHSRLVDLFEACGSAREAYEREEAEFIVPLLEALVMAELEACIAIVRAYEPEPCGCDDCTTSSRGGHTWFSAEELADFLKLTRRNND